MRSVILLILLGLSACSTPDHLPVPRGDATPVNAFVPPDYTGNGVQPVLGGIDPS